MPAWAGNGAIVTRKEGRMRFAFAGFDLWCGVFDAFVAAGWQPLAAGAVKFPRQ